MQSQGSGRVKRLAGYLKREPVLLASGALALLSCCFVPPSAAYLAYIDWRTLGILFCLMAAVAGLSRAGAFTLLAQRLARRFHTVKAQALALTLLCFFSSLWITNDVALITFVPLTLLMLREAGEGTRMYVVVMETIAANLGSVLTPFGNPQNLYIYGQYHLEAGEFFAVTAPLWGMGLVLTAAALLLAPLPKTQGRIPDGETDVHARRMGFFAALFGLSLLAVFRVLPWWAVLGVVCAAVCLLDRSVFRRIDYNLLATFVFFFILVGNLGQIEPVRETISRLIGGREVLVSALVSQGISNVPAALMLSGFTENWRGLLMGVNVGGLGTWVASMASLISFRLYARQEGARTGRYLGIFLVCNMVGLGLLLGAAYLLGWR